MLEAPLLSSSIHHLRLLGLVRSYHNSDNYPVLVVILILEVLLPTSRKEPGLRSKIVQMRMNVIARTAAVQSSYPGHPQRYPAAR